MEWLEITNNSLPGGAFDVWVKYMINGEVRSRRIPDCWYDGAYILNGENNIVIRGATHFMVAEPPKND